VVSAARSTTHTLLVWVAVAAPAIAQAQTVSAKAQPAARRVVISEDETLKGLTSIALRVNVRTAQSVRRLLFGATASGSR